MKPIALTRTIAAPADQVFALVSDIRRYQEAIPDITKVEFQSEQRTGVGTRFRETRRCGKREASTVLECTEFEAPNHIRLVADSFGCVWDSVFRVEAKGEQQCELTLEMEAKPYKFLPRLMNPLMRGMISKGVAKDMDRVQAHFAGK